MLSSRDGADPSLGEWGLIEGIDRTSKELNLKVCSSFSFDVHLTKEKKFKQEYALCISARDGVQLSIQKEVVSESSLGPECMPVDLRAWTQIEVSGQSDLISAPQPLLGVEAKITTEAVADAVFASATTNVGGKTALKIGVQTACLLPRVSVQAGGAGELAIGPQTKSTESDPLKTRLR